ncbi:MAG: YeeE/YedE family protein [Gammaproteobacteria bacterium]|nr:YeeE/YedE family protein [Gammaproteobacteria bacterium]
MELEIYRQVLLAGFIITIILGAVAYKTNFCTMGAVSDLVNMGDSGRMRAWVLGMAVAVLGVAILEYMGLADMSLTTSAETGRPPYRAAVFPWPRFIIGGILFGVGMTIGSGCGNRTMVRIGGGNLKSIAVLLAMGVAGYLMIFTNFGYYVFLQWMQPAFIDLRNLGIADQSLGAAVSGLLGLPGPATTLAAGLLVAALMLVWVLRSSDFLKNRDNVLAGVVLGLCVAAVWYVTAGSMGQGLIEEVAFLEGDEQPYGVGAQSLTFVQPAAILIRYLETGLASRFMSFAMVAGAGVIAGAFLYALVARRLRLEWFQSLGDAARHVIGGLLMGFGGVLSIGCTIGQAVSGVSTLAIGSFLTFVSICLGSALTMKVQYYKMVYEDEANWGSALITGMADLRLIPQKWRRHEAV